MIAKYRTFPCEPYDRSMAHYLQQGEEEEDGVLKELHF